MKKNILLIISIFIALLIGSTMLSILNLNDQAMTTEILISLTLSTILIVTMFYDGIYIRILRDKVVKNKAKKYDYYRDPLDEISPMMGAILLKKKIHEPDVVAAMILYLKSKGIDIEKKLEKHDLSKIDLRPHEIFFVENKNILLKNFYENGYTMYNRNSSYEDCLNDLAKIDLLEEEYLDINGNYTLQYKSMIGPTYYHMFHMFIMNVVPYTATSIYAIILKVLFTVTTLSWCLIDVLVIIFNNINKGNFTEKAYEYINKTKGAKRFLNDYSLISKREVRQEILFDSYVQTAILLDMKGKLDTDVSEYYYNILSNYNKVTKTKSIKFINGNVIFFGIIIYMLAWIWYPKEPATNLVWFHIFAGFPGNICITILFFMRHKEYANRVCKK